MELVLLGLPGNEAMTLSLARRLDAMVGEFVFRRFPDGESYLRLDADVSRRRVLLVCTLDRPDAKLLPLSFLADAARDGGAASVGLICPYLAYMRQDARFAPGEALTSVSFARILSAQIDWLVTVDPHLHRLSSLQEIYPVATSVVRAAPLLAEWVRASVPEPLLIGPDAESEQWVAAVAEQAGAPHQVLEKLRFGDREVQVSAPDVERWRGRTPVLVDDIVSTAQTMLETVRQVRDAGLPAPVCLGIHAVFAGQAQRALQDAGVADIVTSNTIVHGTNRIDVAAPIADAVRAWVNGAG